MQCHFGKCSYFLLITEVSSGWGCFFGGGNMVSFIYNTINSMAYHCNIALYRLCKHNGYRNT